MKITVSASVGGFPCSLEFEAVQLETALRQILELPAHGVYPPTGESIRPLRALQPGEYRALVTQIKRDGDVVRLWFRGCEYESAKVFEIADLDVVGIDYRNLQDGAETPARFFAVYVLSDKLNKNNNPYKDIIWLESAESYNVRTDPLGNVLEAHSALGYVVTGEAAAIPVASHYEEAAPNGAGSTEPPSPPKEPSALDEFFPREPQESIKLPTVGPAEFYGRLGELKTTRKVAFEVDRNPPVSTEIAAAKQSGDWAQAVKALEAQIRM